MKTRKPILSIAGFDPCGGAGVLADVKVFERHHLLGMAVNTAQTYQHESVCERIEWLEKERVLEQIKVLVRRYDFKLVKVGIIPDFAWISSFRRLLPNAKFVIDPVLSISANGENWHFDITRIEHALHPQDILTPNWNEIIAITGIHDATFAAKSFSKCCGIYLKGGHNKDKPNVDYFFEKGELVFQLDLPRSDRSKHGSGCVLSSAIASNLALGHELKESCQRAKQYTLDFLNSSKGLLGYHDVA